MPKAVFKLSLLSTALLLASQNLWAEELEAIDVVGSVAKSGRVEFLSPKSTDVIDQTTLQDIGATQLDQAVRYESGALSQIYGADLDDSDWLKLRGFDATLRLDGTAIYKGGYSGWNPDLYGFEAVEVVKGADSLLYGSSSTGGVINLISKRPKNQDMGEINVYGGNRSQRGVSFDVNKAINENLFTRFVGDYEYKKGETFGTWRERYYFAPSLTWLISDKTTLTLLTSVQKDVGVPTTSFYPLLGTLDTSKGRISRRTNLGDPTTDYMDRRAYSIGYELTHDFGDNLSFSQNYRYSEEQRNQFVAYYGYIDGAFPNIKQSRLLVDVDTHNHTLDNRVTKKWQWDNIENTLTVGIDYQRSSANGYYGYTYGGGNTINALSPIYTGVAKPSVPVYQVKQYQLGAYLQDQLKINNWLLNGSIRHDKARGNSDTFDTKESYRVNNTSYSAGLMYVAENGISPYYSYSQSFQPLAGNDGTGTSYKPIKGTQHEVGIKYLPTFIDGVFSAAYFHLKEENGLVQTNGITTQVAKNISKGIELSADMKLTDNISTALTYTYTKANETERYTGNVIRKPIIPRHTATARVIYQWDKLTLGTGVRYIGTSTDEAGNKGYKVPAVTLIDLMAKYQFNDNWVLRANITNLTDKRYVSGCYYSCYYGEGRKVEATLSYKW
ncbi:TonB-dependent siderophore receptor [Avibacterium avium]|uniref:TonB-dependent siderophore receptor n=1 Tax=Avibacterium avium TaxID=751 RepID=UPI003BF89D42